MKGRVLSHISNWLYFCVILVSLVVFGCYLYYFHDHVSVKPDVWGAFGSYFGGVIGPFVSGITFYLITKSYDEQRNQTKLAALTSLINVNLTKINLLQSEYDMLLREFSSLVNDKELVHRLLFLNEYSGTGNISPIDPNYGEALDRAQDQHLEYESLIDSLVDEKALIYQRVLEVREMIHEFQEENSTLKKRINYYCK